MRVALISDTHCLHEALKVPPCDVLVHAGDFSTLGRTAELDDFLEWFHAQPGAHKVLVAGNHDFNVQLDPAGARRKLARLGIVFLEDETVTVAGLRVHGSPWTPRFGDWAFMLERGAPIAEKWAKIPEGLDLLVTHGPPHGLGDETRRGTAAGCEDLRRRVLAVRPRLHVYGHIHEGFGEYSVEGCPTRFLNVSSTPMPPVSVRQPVVVELG